MEKLSPRLVFYVRSKLFYTFFLGTEGEKKSCVVFL